jgi:nucleoside-diphosphate-sugar epimerase
VAAKLGEVLGRGDVPLDHAGRRPGDVERHFADVTRARRLFGFEATIGLEEGLRRTVDWFRTRRIGERPEAGLAGSANW